MAGPTAPAVPFPLYLCAIDGVVYDRRRSAWYGLPEIQDQLFCPTCGFKMQGEPKEPPVRMFYCYQCGVTYDRQRTSWYGVAYHLPDTH
jgi:hypothetical protein